MLARSLAVAVLVSTVALSARVQNPRASATPAAPRVEKSVPFGVGETLTYDVSWSSYVTAGTAVATVKEKRPSLGSMTYYIVAEGRPTPLVAALYTLYYKRDTLLDVYTLLPQRASAYTEEGRRRRYGVIEFDRAAAQARFEVQSTPPSQSSVKTMANAHDALSAFYAIRAMPLKAGDTVLLPVVDNGKNYRVEVQVEGTERLTTAVGQVTAWRLRPTIVDDRGQRQGRNVVVWLSDDARRLPVRIEADLPVGTFSLTLRSVDSP